MIEIENRQDLLLKKLKTWYNVGDRLKFISDIIDGKSKMSLRIIDFTCTNYAKKNDVIYYIGKTPFNLFVMYRGQLKAYSKMQFDPFRRHTRITLSSGGISVETTIAQLNFFKWAIENKVLDYIRKNMTKIDTAMTNEYKKSKSPKEKIENVIKKTAKRHDVKVTVTFK